MKLDILCFAAHPDDVELGCSGTILHHKKLGKKIGVIDLTQGELGTRGSAELRMIESENASKIMQLDARENLKMADGFFENNQENKIKIIECIRKYQPEIIIANAISDRHIDHGRASALVHDAAFLSGLKKIETFQNGKIQEAWRPKNILHYIQDYLIKPDLLVDITDYMDTKIEIIKCFSSQFYDKKTNEKETPISVDYFFDYVKGRAMDFGRFSGVKYAEGFNVSKPISLSDITLIS